MLKVYLVDDEKLIVDELRKLINWQQHNFEVVGSATDSKQAYNDIIALNPHLVISDINMPRLSGLKLFNKVKATHPHVSFCFLSAYDHFEYMQEALQLGAVNYLKKPIIISELIKLLNNIQTTLNEQFSQLLFEAMITRKYFEHDAYIENLFLTNDSIHKQKKYRIVTFSNFCCEELHNNVVFDDNYYLLSMEQKMRVYLVYETNLDYLAFLTSAHGLAIGVSEEFSDFKFISKHLRLSRIASFQEFITNKPTLTIVTDNPKLEQLIREINETKNVYEIQMLVHNLNKKIIEYEIKCYNLQLIYRTIMFNLIKFDIIPFTYRFDEISVVNNYENLEDFLQQLNSYFIFEEETEDNISVVEQVKAEIKNNISQHYSLSYFAKKYHYNLSYFSQLFKKETGSSFAEYIANVKMDIAKSLMTHHDISLSEIAERVGYKDYYHFSKMFKKITGHTPSSYSKAKRPNI